ncbi:macro domain-containing protein [bacterium]|nr:macro domain-containing protein [bacterium]
MEVNIGRAKLSIVHGDIIESGTEAITNAANDKLWMSGGVAGAIKRAGGEEIETEAMKKGPLPKGGVLVTGAGTLDAKYVIHAVVMGQDLQADGKYVKEATINTIEAADNLPAKSLSMPAFGTGIGHFSAEDCSKIMIEETINGLLTAKNIRQVKIVLKDKGIYEIFKATLEDKFRRR